AVRRTAVCDHAPGAPTKPCARLWSPSVSGSRGGAYVRACSVDRSASRSFSAGCALGKEGLTLDTPSDPLNRADVRICAAYKGGPVVRQCSRCWRLRQAQIASQGVETRPVQPGGIIGSKELQSYGGNAQTRHLRDRRRSWRLDCCRGRDGPWRADSARRRPQDGREQSQCRLRAIENLVGGGKTRRSDTERKTVRCRCAGHRREFFRRPPTCSLGHRRRGTG